MDQRDFIRLNGPTFFHCVFARYSQIAVPVVIKNKIIFHFNIIPNICYALIIHDKNKDKWKPGILSI